MLNSSQMVDRRVAPSAPRQLQGRSKKSQLLFARIVQYIGEQGQASAAQLSALLGLDAGTMRRYLRHCTQPGRQRPALYAAGLRAAFFHERLQ